MQIDFKMKYDMITLIDYNCINNYIQLHSQLWQISHPLYSIKQLWQISQFNKWAQTPSEGWFNLQHLLRKSVF